MWIRRSGRWLVAALVTGVMIAMLGSAATAQRQTVNDSNSDGKWDEWGEIRKMRVAHTDRRLKVATKFDKAGDHHVFHVKVPGRKRWKYAVWWFSEFQFRHVYVYKRSGKTTCALKTAKYTPFWNNGGVYDHSMKLSVPRRCLKHRGKNPRWVKVRQVVRQDAAGGSVVDRTKWTRRLRAG